MSTLTTISGISNTINLGGSALSLVGLGSALIFNKKPKPGIEGFLFDIPLTDNVTHSAQITDHYIEDNSSIQDHVAFEPVRITLTGKVAELIYTKNAGLAFLSAVIDRLTPLGILSPEKALQAQKYIAAVDQLGTALTSAKKVFNDFASVFSSDPYKNAQQRAFETFEKFFFGRAIISVETPWRTYTSMILETWSADQDSESIYETTFTLTFKEARFVSTTTNVGNLIGRIQAQKSDVQDKGTVPGASILSTVTDKVTGTK